MNENDDVLVDPLSDDDESFQLVSNTRSRREKRSALFIGNLEPTTSEERLSKYILSRKIKAEHAVRGAKVFFPIKPGRSTTFARVMVNERYTKYLLSKAFWPGHLYSRFWWFKESEDGSGGRDELATNQAETCEQPSSELKDSALSEQTSPDGSCDECHATPARAGKHDRSMVSPGDGQSPDCKKSNK